MPVRSSLPRSRHYAATFCKGVKKGLSVLRSSLHKKRYTKPRNRNPHQQLSAPCEVLKFFGLQTCHGVRVTRCLLITIGYTNAQWYGKQVKRKAVEDSETRFGFPSRLIFFLARGCSFRLVFSPSPCLIHDEVLRVLKKTRLSCVPVFRLRRRVFRCFFHALDAFYALLLATACGVFLIHRGRCSRCRHPVGIDRDIAFFAHATPLPIRCLFAPISRSGAASGQAFHESLAEATALNMAADEGGEDGGGIAAGGGGFQTNRTLLGWVEDWGPLLPSDQG